MAGVLDFDGGTLRIGGSGMAEWGFYPRAR